MGEEPYVHGYQSVSADGKTVPAARRANHPGNPWSRLRVMKISVRLFAGLRERAGADHVELDLPDDARAADVLARDGPAAGAVHRRAGPRVRGAPTSACGRTHEVALIPPVSGGSDVVRLVDVTEAPLDIAAVAAAVRDPRAGAVVHVRGRHARGRGARLRGVRGDGAREAAPRSARRRPSATGCARWRSVHRVGRVPLSEPSVIVAASRCPPRRGVRRRPRADRPGEGGGADLEGRADARGRAPGRGRAAVAELTLGEAARALGVSADTLRRWDRAGKLRHGPRRAQPAAGAARGGRAALAAPAAAGDRATPERPQPVPGRRALGRGRRRDGAGGDRGGAAPDRRGGHARRRRGARLGARRARHGGRQGDVRDGRDDQTLESRSDLSILSDAPCAAPTSTNTSGRMRLLSSSGAAHGPSSAAPRPAGTGGRAAGTVRSARSRSGGPHRLSTARS